MKKILITLTVFMALITMETVTAKGFRSSSSFSRPSYSRPSYKQKTTYRNSKATYRKPKAINSTNKTTNNKTKSMLFSKPITTSRFDNKKGFTKKKSESVKIAHAKHISKFKKPVSKGSPRLTSDKSNSYVKSTYGYDKSTTLTRRNSYYNSYTPPSYIYQSQPSFGMWDSLAMWYMLDNISNRNQYQMAYHHQSDPGFQEWRREADRLAEDNAELKVKLRQLDDNVNSLKGTAVNTNYVPEGVDADILLSDDVANTKPTLKICSGSIYGMYSTYAYKMKAVLSSNFDTSIILTNGSNDNVKLLNNGQCDMAITQRDVFDLFSMCSNSTSTELTQTCNERGIQYSKNTSLNFTRIHTPFYDSVIGICNGVSSLDDAKTIVTVDHGGDTVTISNLELELKALDFTHIKSKSMLDSLQKVEHGDADCTILVTNYRSKILTKLNGFKGLEVVNIINPEIYEIKDPIGSNVYMAQRLSVDVLGDVADKNSHGFFNKYILNPKVPVDIIMSNTYDPKLTDIVSKKIINITL